MKTDHHDVVVVGAGISGIDAAYRLQTQCPGKRFVILEGRERLGGTWDLFRYPGIRSDSDMFTLGFPFRPWSSRQAIADGPAILAYLQETAQAYGIDRKIRFGQRVEGARWSSDTRRWTLDVRDLPSGHVREVSCGFLLACSGYYDYEAGYTPELAGRERFGGRIVHPQLWTDDIDYAGKRVVVIGSGATAVTLVPALAARAAHVTMLQRSPSYILSVPQEDPIAAWLMERLPVDTAYQITRWKNVLLGMVLYQVCRRLPGLARRQLLGLVEKDIGHAVDVKVHFSPTYDPWDQRMCLIPDGDLFAALRGGKVSVVTDHIEGFTETGLRLRSGQELEADLVVTATGLRMRFLGGMALEIDGKTVKPSSLLTYKGILFSDVPNLALCMGYTNASWTLRADLISQYLCRLLNHMDRHGHAVCMPQADGSEGEAPLMGLASGYVQRAMSDMPRQGTRAPWEVYQNYLLDLMALRHTAIDDGVLRFS